MKKLLLIFILLAGVSLKSEAQHFVASFGVEHSWGVPAYISDVVHHDYYGYDWVHASRVHSRGHLFFDIVLQRGDIFLELRVRNDGHVIHRQHRNYYPLHDHVCSSHCGYHANYYRTYYRDCHSHRHHGHNHVAYVYRPSHSHGHSHYKHRPHHTYKSKGNHHGHHKHSSGKYYSSRKNYKHQDNDHRSYRERRDRNHDDIREHGRKKYGDKKGRAENGRNRSKGTYVRRGH